MRKSLEASLQHTLAAEFVQLGPFIAVNSMQVGYDFSVMLVAGAGGRGCARLGFAVHDALRDIAAWLMGTFVAASTDANVHGVATAPLARAGDPPIIIQDAALALEGPGHALSLRRQLAPPPREVHLDNLVDASPPYCYHCNMVFENGYWQKQVHQAVDGKDDEDDEVDDMPVVPRGTTG